MSVFYFYAIKKKFEIYRFRKQKAKINAVLK